MRVVEEVSGQESAQRVVCGPNLLRALRSTLCALRPPGI